MIIEQELVACDSPLESAAKTLSKPLRDAKRLTSSVGLNLVLTSVRSLFVFHILGPTLMGAWRSAATVDSVHEIARMGVVRGMSIRVPVLDGAGRSAEADEMIGESGSLMLWLGIVMAIGIFASSFLIADHNLRVAMQWMAPLGLVTEPYVFLRELAAARHRIDLRSKETIFRGLVEFITAIALCGALKLAGLGTGMVLSVAAAAVYLYYRQAVPFRLKPRWSAIRQSIRIGAPFSLSEGAYELIRRIDVLIMAFLLGPTSVGYYSVSRLIADFSTVFCQRGIAPALSPHLLHAFGRTGSVHNASVIFEQPARLLSYTLPAVLGVGTFFCEHFIRLLLPQYIPGTAAAQVSLWSVLFVALHATVGSFIVAAGIVPAVLRTYAVLIPLGALAEYVVLKTNLGLEGAAWCTLTLLAMIGAAEIVIAKRKCGETYAGLGRLIAALYLPVLCAIVLRYGVTAATSAHWFPIGRASLLTPFVESLAFLLFYAPLLFWYERRFSLLRTLRQSA
jgi:O-antigen/teichoic acid export membrane protein